MIARDHQHFESGSLSGGVGLPDLDARYDLFSLDEVESVTGVLTLARGPSQSKKSAEGEI